MTQNPIEVGRLSSHGQGLGTVTEEMVRQRASEIAVINGRSQKNILEADLAQARRELQGEERLTPATPRSETIPEEDRWASEGTDSGKKAETIPTPDEQTYAEKLVEEGVADAEHDQQLEATRESLRREKRP